MKRVLLPLALVTSTATPAWADLALATNKNCMTCHSMEKKVIGPAYKEVAAKYKNDKGATDTLAAKIRAGGVGVWGQIPMPANAQVNDADAKRLAAWILQQK